MGRVLKFGVACGGTGGHTFPGIATASELAARGHEVTLWLAGKDVEHDSVRAWQGEIITIPSEGFLFGFSLRSLQTVAKLRKAYKLSVTLMREHAPNAMLAMGSYASFGPVRAAAKFGIPYVMHEANLVPGRAVSLLARRADTIAVSFERTGFFLKHGNIVTTGMPLRKELETASREPRTAWAEEDPLRILVMGGSGGAQVLNETVPKAITAAAEKGLRLHVEHISGIQDTESLEAAYAPLGANAHVHHFVQEMAEKYLAADLAICRSGAATCAELAAFGLPALLVPYPHAVRDHQMSNARVLQDAGAADVVAQEDLTDTWLCDYLINVAQKPARLEAMSVAMKKQAQSDATSRLADLLEKVAGA